MAKRNKLVILPSGTVKKKIREQAVALTCGVTVPGCVSRKSQVHAESEEDQEIAYPGGKGTSR